jgi:hypothetical protein
LKGQDGDGHDQGRPQQDPGDGALIGEASDPGREHRQVLLCRRVQGVQGVQEKRLGTTIRDTLATLLHSQTLA